MTCRPVESQYIMVQLRKGVFEVVPCLGRGTDLNPAYKLNNINRSHMCCPKPIYSPTAQYQCHSCMDGVFADIYPKHGLAISLNIPEHA